MLRCATGAKKTHRVLQQFHQEFYIPLGGSGHFKKGSPGVQNGKEYVVHLRLDLNYRFFKKLPCCAQMQQSPTNKQDATFQYLLYIKNRVNGKHFVACLEKRSGFPQLLENPHITGCCAAVPADAAKHQRGQNSRASSPSGMFPMGRKPDRAFFRTGVHPRRRRFFGPFGEKTFAVRSALEGGTSGDDRA